MKDLTNPGWIKAKGALFLLLGISSAILLWLEQPTLRAAIYLVVAIWSFCRAYYFAFYVIGHYVDPSFKFSGLGAFLKYLIAARKRQR